jgi:hypothetical protein
MPLELESSESVESGNFLERPGTYHLYVFEAEESPMSAKQKPIDGLRFNCVAMAGTTPGQEKRTIRLTVYHPNPTHKDGGDFCLRLRTRFLWAIGVLNKPGEKIVFDGEKCKGMQFIATLVPSEDPKFLQLDGMHFWHVDDPDAAAFPKDQAALKLLPKELRRSPDAFKKLPSAASGNGSAAATPAPAPKSTVNLDDL